VSGWNCTAGLYWTALVLLVLVEFLYTPEVCRRRGAGSHEEARSSGEVLCSVYAAAAVVRDDQVRHVRSVQLFAKHIACCKLSEKVGG
jgi:hypothetical protein